MNKYIFTFFAGFAVAFRVCCENKYGKGPFAETKPVKDISGKIFSSIIRINYIKWPDPCYTV